MEEVKVICLSWLQLSNNGTKVMYRNISKYALISILWACVCEVYFNCVEIAYLSKTVREADSLSSVQSVNLITRFSSNESLQYRGDEGGLLVPDLCFPSRLFFCFFLPLNMLYCICHNKNKNEIKVDRYIQLMRNWNPSCFGSFNHFSGTGINADISRKPTLRTNRCTWIIIAVVILYLIVLKSG